MLVWVRKPETIEYAAPSAYERWVKKIPFPFPTISYSGYNENNRFHLCEYIIGFCGKIYPLLHVGKGLDPLTTYCYTLDDVNEFVEKHFKEREIEDYKRKKGKGWHYRHWKNWNYEQRQEKIKAFFTECEEKKNSFVEIFREKRCPVFVAKYQSWNNASITYHACNLKELEFMRVFDPYTTFQEIAMFFGNMVIPLKEPPVPDDKTMAEIKGFTKYSFRKDKSK